MKNYLLLIIIALSCWGASAQHYYFHPPDSTEKWNFHFQMTVIDQSHTAFSAAYSGQNSLSPASEEALSITTTLFIGRALWKGASLYFNPEISGGSGISSTRGVAGFTNGETFRIGSPAPALYLGRLFYRQYIALGEKEDLVPSDNNQLKAYVPRSRIVITAGKFSVSDLFDQNSYSHDSRTQFINWSLMSNGAWDYAANTRGYTDGVALEYITPEWEGRAATTLEPSYANGPELDYNYFKAYSQTVEVARCLSIKGRKGFIRLLLFRNVNKAPRYTDVIKSDPALDVIYGKSYGGVKYGYGFNIEQELNDNLGVFARAGWNDGKTATWAFTEIDKSVSAGANCKGSRWGRAGDVFGIAGVLNGISDEHRAFLNAGGYGFIIGDGKLPNYSTENILEAYYNAKINKNLFLSADYQFVQHPAYNADRGPVNVYAIRAHVEF